MIYIKIMSAIDDEYPPIQRSHFNELKQLYEEMPKDDLIQIYGKKGFNRLVSLLNNPVGLNSTDLNGLDPYDYDEGAHLYRDNTRETAIERNRNERARRLGNLPSAIRNVCGINVRVRRV
jgi:hypothetical protein